MIDRTKTDPIRDAIFAELKETLPDVTMREGSANAMHSVSTVFVIPTDSAQFPEATSSVEFTTMYSGAIEAEVTTRALSVGYMRGYRWNSKAKAIPTTKVAALVSKQLERGKLDAGAREKKRTQKVADMWEEDVWYDTVDQLNAQFPGSGIRTYYDTAAKAMRLSVTVTSHAAATEVFRRLSGCFTK